MSRVFIVPDVHLKPWMFKKATELIKIGEYDRVVFLGDLVDDFNQEKNLELYEETFEAIYDFLEEFPDTLYCIGNHDISYVWQERESGYSDYAREIVCEGMSRIRNMLPEGNIAFIHRIDNTLFSHAGLTMKFVLRYFGRGPKLEIDELLRDINNLGRDELWSEIYATPIWARPQSQYDNGKLYPWDMFQVVGHSPVERPLLDGKLLTLDTFSTHYNGTPYGNQKFVWVDTVTGEYCYAE